MSTEWFTPSLLHSLDDPLISFESLYVCNRCYMQNPLMDPVRDYLLSPLFAPDDVLRKFPPIRMFLGEIDPLYDDSVRLALRL